MFYSKSENPLLTFSNKTLSSSTEQQDFCILRQKDLKGVSSLKPFSGVIFPYLRMNSSLKSKLQSFGETGLFSNTLSSIPLEI